ncbi:hypothetical protein G7K_5602-t1 [Saitoella complicata NRRL Y-17804]|uniref:RING-type domain-containing protein n=2 Tax=Saitoella complicata (strain BCRC 22490 / CBS 7301 / JCM 7358 / NBRC 10748 / NRRL Y-17804) TaxID=698492 RepID=A0A0E9NNX5_SAICN|nr:hypothetical protein G7K_5602-t1 [Saitoella complicata NRRL Y-17804]
MMNDSYISDDEEDLECPLCMEEMDLSDRNFKPCPCGYQVCRFCWNHIRENLNGRCPACRRLYSEETVEFKPMTAEEYKTDQNRLRRVQNEKKLKEKERREMEAASRKHLANMRVVQKNLVYVTGLSPKIANEELLQTLRGPDYFGQYGKISKIVINKKNPTAMSPAASAVAHASGQIGPSGTLGVYITYATKEAAARAIAAVDGSVNDGRILRASYGTTKYCSAYLRNQPCPNPNCMYLHEPGEDIESYTREDLSTIQHTAKQAEFRPTPTPPQSATPQPTRVIPSAVSRPRGGFDMEYSGSSDAEGSALPATASWASNSKPAPPPAPKEEEQRKARVIRLGPTPKPVAAPKSVDKTKPEPLPQAPVQNEVKEKVEEKEKVVSPVKPIPTKAENATAGRAPVAAAPIAPPKPVEAPVAVAAAPAPAPVQEKQAPKILTQKRARSPTDLFDNMLQVLASSPFKFVFAASVASSPDFAEAKAAPSFFTFDREAGLKQRDTARQAREAEQKARAAKVAASARAEPPVLSRNFDPFALVEADKMSASGSASGSGNGHKRQGSRYGFTGSAPEVRAAPGLGGAPAAPAGFAGRTAPPPGVTPPPGQHVRMGGAPGLGFAAQGTATPPPPGIYAAPEQQQQPVGSAAQFGDLQIGGGAPNGAGVDQKSDLLQQFFKNAAAQPQGQGQVPTGPRGGPELQDPAIMSMRVSPAQVQGMQPTQDDQDAPISFNSSALLDEEDSEPKLSTNPSTIPETKPERTNVDPVSVVENKNFPSLPSGAVRTGESIARKAAADIPTAISRPNTGKSTASSASAGSFAAVAQATAATTVPAPSTPVSTVVAPVAAEPARPSTPVRKASTITLPPSYSAPVTMPQTPAPATKPEVAAMPVTMPVTPRQEPVAFKQPVKGRVITIPSAAPSTPAASALTSAVESPSTPAKPTYIEMNSTPSVIVSKSKKKREAEKAAAARKGEIEVVVQQAPVEIAPIIGRQKKQKKEKPPKEPKEPKEGTTPLTTAAVKELRDESGRQRENSVDSSSSAAVSSMNETRPGTPGITRSGTPQSTASGPAGGANEPLSKEFNALDAIASLAAEMDLANHVFFRPVLGLNAQFSFTEEEIRNGEEFLNATAAARKAAEVLAAKLDVSLPAVEDLVNGGVDIIPARDLTEQILRGKKFIEELEKKVTLTRREAEQWEKKVEKAARKNRKLMKIEVSGA